MLTVISSQRSPTLARAAATPARSRSTSGSTPEDADARQRVDVAHQLRARLRELLQDLVAAQVAVLVVDAFEIVDVDERHGERRAVAPGALDFLAQPVHEVAAVEETGQVVGDALHAQLLVCDLDLEHEVECPP